MLLREIVNAQKAWTEIADQKMDVRASFVLMKYIKRLDEELKLFNEQRTRIVNEFSEKSDGEQTIPKEKAQTVIQMLNDLMNIESDIPLIDMTLDELVQSLQMNPGNTISTTALVCIEPFFKTQDEKAPDA